MTIAVNTRFLLKDKLEGYGYFILETFSRMASLRQDDRFIYIFDRPYDKSLQFPPNVETVVTGPPARHPILWKYWYDIKIPGILRKYKADVFVSPDGFCSLSTKVPQCIVVHDLAFLHDRSWLGRSAGFYYKKYTPAFLKISKSIATVSEFSKAEILKEYPFLNPANINIVYSAARNIFKPLSYLEKEKHKEEYTGGKDYFIYTGAIHPRKNLVNLLKAFSIFKKWQASEMKLVLVGRVAWKKKGFAEALSTYKYRKDIILTGYIDEDLLWRYTASAYAMIYPSFYEGFGVPVLEAMSCAVPVVSSSGTAMQELFGDAALFADPADPGAIAEQILRLYKDEKLRDALIEKGKLLAAGFSWDDTAALLWKSVAAAVS
jgi:glycosyltransferase involved in cell wall biosynthesis